MKRTYTLVIKEFNIVRESNVKEAIVEAIEKLFGSEKANSVKTWADVTIEGTYSDNEFAIHCLCNV